MLTGRPRAGMARCAGRDIGVAPVRGLKPTATIDDPYGVESAELTGSAGVSPVFFALKSCVRALEARGIKADSTAYGRDARAP